ncbi:MAG: endo-1,4-beta-xylanase [Anaerolineae bacterium]|nr:endo-1,4-beta-xylanase [Anaerolineae bacterium]
MRFFYFLSAFICENLRPHLLGRMGRVVLYITLLCFLTTCSTAKPASPRLAAHTLKVDDPILKRVDAAAFDSLVQVFAWREIEPTQNQFHWQATDQIVAGAEYYGLELIVRLDQHPAWASAVDLSLNAPPDKLEDYEDFVQHVAERYRGRIKAYIIWNEPNLAIEWGGQPPDPPAFVELMRVGYEAVKAADPEALVIAAGLAPTNSNDATAMDDRQFLREMYAASAADYFDVLGAHPYSFGQAPNAPQSDSQHPAFGRLAELRHIMAENDDDHKPVWITELGWTIDPPPEQADIKVTLNQQAAYLAEALTLVRRDWPWVELVTVWNVAIPGEDDPFGGYSLLNERSEPRPALAAWQAAAELYYHDKSDTSSTQAYPQTVISVLADDVVIHLGDTDLQPPWWPLFGGRKPSLTWTGGFYVVDPGSDDWQLTLELMQQNEIGATVAVNGVSLEPDLPQQDFTRRWLSVQRTVPIEHLRPGYNALTITTVRLLPDAQQDEFVWDDFQVKNIRLARRQ